MIWNTLIGIFRVALIKLRYIYKYTSLNLHIRLYTTRKKKEKITTTVNTNKQNKNKVLNYIKYRNLAVSSIDDIYTAMIIFNHSIDDTINYDK